MFRIAWRWAGRAVGGALSTAGLLASSPQASPPQFRTDINFVELHVSVSDARGAHVAGLTRDEFRVRERGVQQEVATFEEVALPLPPSAGGSRTVLPNVDPSVADTGHLAAGRIYILVFDAQGLRSSATPKYARQLAQFVDDALTPADLAAVVNLSSGIYTPFTSSKPRLRAALELDSYYRGAMSQETLPGTPGGGGRFDAAVADAMADLAVAFATGERSRETTNRAAVFAAVARLAEYVSGFEGRRKSLVYFSGGTDLLTASGTPRTSLDAGARGGAYTAMLRALQAANVSVYSVDLEGLARFDPYDAGGAASALPSTIGTAYAPAVEMMRAIADDTGGIAAIGYNDLSAPFRRIVEDNSRYYVIGYVSNQAPDGRTHDVSVEVQGRQVTVRTRRSVQSFDARARRADGKGEPLDTAWRSSDLGTLLRRPLPANAGVRLRISSVPVIVTPDRVTLQLTAEVPPGALHLVPSGEQWTGEVRVAWQVIGVDGRLEAHAAEDVAIRASAATKQAIDSVGWRYVAEVDVPPGIHQMRVAVQEGRHGPSGSAFVDVAAPTLGRTKGNTLAIAGVALASNVSRQVPTAGASPVVRSAIGAPASATRIFASGDTLRVMASIVDPASRGRTASVNWSLVNAEGIPVKRGAELLAADTLAPGAPPRVTEIDLAGLPAGSYAILVTVAAGADRATHVTPIELSPARRR